MKRSAALAVVALMLAVSTGARAQLFTDGNPGRVTGAPNVTPLDCSGTITIGGTAQPLFTAMTTLKGFLVMNLSNDPMWISFTGTAAVGASGSYLLNPGSTTTAGGSFSSPMAFGVNTAPSIIAATTGDKYSCTRW